MVLLVDGLEAFAGDVRVHFRCRDAGMPEQFLYDPQVSAVFQKVCGKTMPQHVRRDVTIDAGQGAPFLDARPQCHCRKRCAAAREEHITRTLAGLGQFGTSVFHVTLNCLAGAAADRHDALVSASKLVLDIRKMAAEDEICRVTTVGSIQATPNAVNVIPGSAKLGLEFRDVDMDAMAAAERELTRAAQRTSASDGVAITVNRHRFNPSVPIDSGMQSLVAEAAGRCGRAWEALPSGAGHDAQAIASIAPMAMLYVPRVDGNSHAVAEYSTPEDCANGTQALLELLLMADNRI